MPPNSDRVVWLVLIFAMLWVPIGQHDFLIPHWMKVGTFLAPFLLFMAATFRPSDAKPAHTDLAVLSVWMLVAYIVHQFEEHWVDVLGNEYAFYGTVNALLMGVFDVEEGARPLTPAGIFVINTSLVWLVGAVAIWRSPRHVFPALAMASIIVVNAGSHIVVGIANLAYNPGLLTSLVVFLPLGGYVYRLVWHEGSNRTPIVVSLIWGVLAHVIMVGGLVVGQIFGLFPEPVYFAALVAWSIVPLFLFVNPDRP